MKRSILMAGLLLGSIVTLGSTQGTRPLPEKYRDAQEPDYFQRRVRRSEPQRSEPRRSQPQRSDAAYQVRTVPTRSRFYDVIEVTDSNDRLIGRCLKSLDTSQLVALDR